MKLINTYIIKSIALMCLLERSHACDRGNSTSLCAQATGMFNITESDRIPILKAPFLKAPTRFSQMFHTSAESQSFVTQTHDSTSPVAASAASPWLSKISALWPLCQPVTEASRALYNKLCGPEGADTESGLCQLATCGERSQKKADACKAVMQTAVRCGAAVPVSIGPVAWLAKWLANRLCGPNPGPDADTESGLSGLRELATCGERSEKKADACEVVVQTAAFACGYGHAVTPPIGPLQWAPKMLANRLCGPKPERQTAIPALALHNVMQPPSTDSESDSDIQSPTQDVEKTKPDRRRVLSSERSPFWDLAELLA